MSNIIRAIFNNVNDKEVFAKARYQYDYGMVLRFEGAVTLPSTFEVHFALEKHGEAITQIGDPEGVPVPDALFLAGKTIYAWAYLHSGEDDGYTEYMVQIPVIQRAQPSDEVPTPVQQSAIDQAIAALGVAVEQTAADVEITTEKTAEAQASAEAAAASAAEAAETAENVEENVTAARAAKAAAEAARDRAVQAETSANQSKTAAATSETNAAASATAASASASAALTSEENANGAMMSAYSDANRADTAADTATSAKNDAVNAKTAAQSAKTAAETAATTATQKASAAATSADTATTKATAAANSATAAAGSATAAANSATEAATTAQGISDHLDQIDENTDAIEGLKEELNDIAVLKKSTNLFNKATITPNMVIWQDGASATFANTYVSDYIPVEGNTQYTWRSEQFWVAMYDANKAFVSSSTQGQATITTTAATKYIRLVLSSGYSADLVQVNKGSVLLPYEEFYEYYVLKSDKPIIVDAAGAGDYTSLTQALYETRNTHENVIVRKGIYNLVDEYKAVFGDTIWTSMNDSTALDRFQYGLYIDQRSVTFEVGAKIVCDLTDTGYVTQVDTTPYNKFSAICMGANAKLYNARVEATKTYYLCHDDFLTALPSFENVYDGCVLIGTSLHQTNVIGGGTQPGGSYKVLNSYLSNGLGANSVTMRYHGANVQNSRGRVEIANCKITGKLGVKWYGDQTCEVLWLIHNNEFGSEILRSAEVASQYPDDNTVVYEWGNTVKAT